MTVREKALTLRKEGHSYSYIATKTGLSKSMLSYYLSKVPYKPNTLTIRRIGHARAKSGWVKAEAKRNAIRAARSKARADIGKLTNRDLFMLGLGLYIGEGSKTQNIIRVVNTDYRVIKLAIRWLCGIGYTSANFTMRLHLYPDSNIKDAELFWSTKTGIPLDQFQKVYVDTRVSKDRKRNMKHVYGTAHLTIRSNGDKSLGVQSSRRIGAWMEEVLK